MTHTVATDSSELVPDSGSALKGYRYWPDWFLAGFVESCWRIRQWLRLYLCAGALGVIGLSLADQGRPPWLLPFELGGLAVSLVLLLPLLRWGYGRYEENHSRWFSRSVIVLSVIGSLGATVCPVLIAYDNFRKVMLVAGLATALGAVIITLVLVFPASSFHPDFAHLRMYKRTSRFLEIMSGLFLFAVGGQQVLLLSMLVIKSPKTLV